MACASRMPGLPEPYEVMGVSKEEYDSSASLQEAHAYLEACGVPRLMESLLARVVLDKPQDLRQYLVQRLQEMQDGGGSPSMGCFTEEDLSTMFDMWDALKVGALPAPKVAESLRALGCSRGKEDDVVAGFVGSLDASVDKPTFIKIVRAQLEACFSSPAFQGKA
uniref:Uncharacterized protein n=1 Tax=Zooxanthella nutricula TaxID=1333877 RepID=A0A7S2HXS9_9DINO